ncbi:hypothetical protein [Kineococcus sp. SYSU DK003]|uniref:hypothetical protein n=1 Tax=Kineococcus sp. SYSU DK003 TaxID=3383124 RepID=UPI003D7E59EA
MTEERPPHGYTKATRSDHGLVTQRHLGPGASLRQHAEVTALRHLAGTLPVPALLHDQAERVFRTRRLHLLGALPNLFDGYGTEPARGRRQAAMVAECEWP